jgi:hypothetical protein
MHHIIPIRYKKITCPTGLVARALGPKQYPRHSCESLSSRKRGRESRTGAWPRLSQNHDPNRGRATITETSFDWVAPT